MLQLINYRKHFDSLPVLDIPSLTLPPGVHWIKGHNGAGKTTLLKSIAGLIPFDGEIYVNNTSLRTQRRRYLKQVNYAEAEPLYPSFLTGNDLIDFYFHTKGGTISSINPLIESLDAGYFLPKKADSYSSGMLKKLSLVLAFIGDPVLILLDEPFITLDAAAVQVLQQLIEEKQTAGVSFCISSHQDLTIRCPFSTLHLQNKKAEPA